MIRTTGLKRWAVASVAALVSLPLALTGCSKGGDTAKSGSGEVTMWTHNAGNKAELGAIQQIVNDYNASQSKYKVKVQAFPQDSYNQSVVSAAASKKLPCVLDIDGPNVPNWAWAQYLAPLDGMDDTLSKFLPSTVGKYNNKNYSFGYYDVALSMITRKSTLDAAHVRVPTMDKPWTASEFTSALASIKALKKFQYPLDLGTSGTGEWWPYAYSPFLESFGGDLINRSDYKTADGALNGPEAVAWAKWFRGLVTNKDIALKSGADSTADFINGKTGMFWSGSWAGDSVMTKFGKDALFLPPPDMGKGPKIGGGSWQWGLSQSCSNKDGALDYLKFAAADKYVALVSKATGTIPATDAAAATVPGYEANGKYDVFRQLSKKFAEVRPATPGYPFISTEFAKIGPDILNGADPQTSLNQAVKDIDSNQKSNNYFQS